MSWFTPTCPVDAETKEWIENGLNWLIEELGADMLASVEVVLPIEQYFPDPFSGSDSDIRRMVERVCGYMDVDPTLLELRFYVNEDGSDLHPLAASESGSHALGSYQMRGGKYQIRLETSQAANPQVMVATIAHELGHVILLGEGRLDPDYPDHEPMTDLLTVFYGMGIFNSNSVFSFEQWTNTQSQGWRADRRGYLSEEMFGYALALFAYARNESKPEWASYLNVNVKSYFKNGFKYLTKTRDTTVQRVDAQAADSIA
ncbi:MAG TPA: hypothetical protein VNA22_01655 [Pyrinomonadaceae bacterium]|nr:hypothetical protein [Pyrinomonadaceae bacterium]